MHEQFFLTLQANPPSHKFLMQSAEPPPLFGREIVFVQPLSSLNPLQTMPESLVAAAWLRAFAFSADDGLPYAHVRILFTHRMYTRTQDPLTH